MVGRELGKCVSTGRLSTDCEAPVETRQVLGRADSSSSSAPAAAAAARTLSSQQHSCSQPTRHSWSNLTNRILSHVNCLLFVKTHQHCWRQNNTIGQVGGLAEAIKASKWAYKWNLFYKLKYLKQDQSKKHCSGEMSPAIAPFHFFGYFNTTLFWSLNVIFEKTW